MSEQQTKCELCGEPMPPGEEMFKYHGFSGPCPKSPTPAAEDEADEEAARSEGSEDSWAPPLRRPVPPATSKPRVPNLMEALKQLLRNAKLGEPTPPATPRGSCAFGQHEWKGTNAEGSCICGELTLSRTPPATPQETALKPEQIYMAGWREGWEAAKVSTDRVPHVSEMVAAWERSEAKNLTVSLSPPPDVERLTQRPETGPMQFGDDWPGVFVRGDNAGGIVSTLMSVIDLVEKTQPMQAVPLRSIMRLFDSSDVRKKPEVQKAELVAGADPVPVCQWREIGDLGSYATPGCQQSQDNALPTRIVQRFRNCPYCETPKPLVLVPAEGEK